jgi:hypothetical protein
VFGSCSFSLTRGALQLRCVACYHTLFAQLRLSTYPSLGKQLQHVFTSLFGDILHALLKTNA